jgi:hypothetical protein
MSTTLFTMEGAGQFQNRGRAVAVNKWNPFIKINLQEWDWFESLSAIITRISTTEQCNYQFLHTLGDHIYLYVFGDRIGQLGIGGLTFNDNCQDPLQEDGISKVIRWFRQRRVAVRKEPIIFQFLPDEGLGPLKGYLVDMRGDTVDACQRLSQFYLTIALIPQRLESQ